MKPLQRGIWRPVRYLILLASAGAVLAADNTWMTSLRFADSTTWLSNLFAAETPRAEVAFSHEYANSNAVELSMSRLLNGLLFSRASNGWRLAQVATEGSSDWMAQQNGPSVSSGGFLAPTLFSSGFISAEPIAAVQRASLPDVPTAPTANGSWVANASGNWGTSANWAGGVIADGAGALADFNSLNITTDVTVSLDTSRTVGELYIGDTNGTHRYTIAPVSGTTLTFDSGVAFQNAVLQQATTSGGDTVGANILLNSDLDINNLSSSNPFQITGNIASSAGPSSFQNIWFNRTAGSGDISVSGNISNGNGSISVVVVDGTVTFTGTNTYSGSTSVDGGMLLVNGNNSGATGTTFVSGTGSVLGGTGTIGSGNVQTFDGTITGATTTTVGTLTFLGNVDLSTGEGNGTYLANLSGSMSDLLAITGSLSLGQGSILDIDGVGDGVTTYTLATFASRDDVFGSVLDIPGGYMLVYHDMDIQLVPIPEPATWIGGALVLGVLGFTQRRRLRGLLARHA